MAKETTIAREQSATGRAGNAVRISSRTMAWGRTQEEAIRNRANFLSTRNTENPEAFTRNINRAQSAATRMIRRINR